MIRAPRVLWHSVAPWSPSGYGGQTRLMIRSLTQAGYDVVLSAGSEVSSASMRWNSYDVYPSPVVAGGSLAHWANHLLDPDGGDLVVTLIDGFRLYQEPLADLDVPVLSWLPIHGLDIEPGLATHLRQTGSHPIALSPSGAVAFERSGFDQVPILPHGIDLEIFRMLVDRDRARSRELARERLGLSNASFLVGVVATNVEDRNRKSLPEVLAAVGLLAARRPGVEMFLLSDYRGRWTGGADLHRVAQRMGLEGVVPIHSTGELSYRSGVPDEDLAIIYNAMDVLCAPSGAEGFCLPLLEAQACGVPVVASDFTSQADLVAHGIVVRGQLRWMAEYDTFWFAPDIDAIATALDQSRSLEGDWKVGTEFARRFDQEALFANHWLPLLKRHGSEAAPIANDRVSE